MVLAPDDRAFAALDWSAFAGKLEPLYCGGETRRDSVYNGLVAAMTVVEASDWMLVHDAARPLPAAQGSRHSGTRDAKRRGRWNPGASDCRHREESRQG